jgi:hypothetical protein
LASASRIEQRQSSERELELELEGDDKITGIQRGREITVREKGKGVW